MKNENESENENEYENENENEEYNYNIIIIGKYEEKDKNAIINLFGNPQKSEKKINNIEIKERNDIECYTRQVNEKIFKEIRIIVLKDFDINNENKNNLFQNLMEKLDRKGLICFHLTKDEKINILKNIIEYTIVSYDHPLFTFIENEENKNELIKMKYNLYQEIKKIDCKKKKYSIYSKRIKFINKKYLIYKLLRDYHMFNYINNKDIIIQFDLQYFKEKPTINLMLCGSKRSGKSSLVNLLLGEEISYADSGNSVTNCISEYSHKKYNLTIFDTVGFTKKDDKDKVEEVDKVINDIKKFCEENQICYKKKIHLFLFCINKESGFIDIDDKKFLEFLINEENYKNNKIMIIFTHVPDDGEKKNTKKKFTQELEKLNIKQEKKKELESNTVYLDLFDSSVEDFEALLKKILNILEPEIEKLNQGKIKDTIFWGKLEKTEIIKKEVYDSITKYKRLSFLSSYIPLPFLDIYSDYLVREYMFDKIADKYKELLEEKIPDDYKDPDVRKIVAKASKYTYLNSDGTFYPIKKYKDIYNKLKKKKDDDNKKDDNKIIDDNTVQNELQPLITDEDNNKNENNENQEEKEIEDIQNYIQMKEEFEKMYWKNEEGINDIRQTNCSKLKLLGNILNDVLKSSSSVSGILKLFFKEIKISYAIPIVGYIVSSTVFGELNVKSLKNKINIIIDEIDGSLSSKEKEEKIAEQLVNNFNILKNDYLKEFSKDGNNYDVEISGLKEKEKDINIDNS